MRSAVHTKQCCCILTERCVLVHDLSTGIGTYHEGNIENPDEALTLACACCSVATAFLRTAIFFLTRASSFSMCSVLQSTCTH